MGWGICFDLDANGRVYCADGCNWRATKADYEDYPKWPSARESVLEYFEGEAHRELDMIRDEFPGTAAGLKEACAEHIGSALRHYYYLSDAEKTKRHQEKMEHLQAAVTLTEEKKKNAYEEYLERKKAFKAYKPPTRNPKTRIDELRDKIAPLELEESMEVAALNYDQARSELDRLRRDLKLEKLFTLE
ncbi:hypothetical protein EBT31_11365 [bacterium]|nr:hypothetical protein [bacterium]NBX48617.1 hypothetical protein [bacterium]